MITSETTKNEIINKIISGEYIFEEINCAICNKRNFERLAYKERHGFNISIVICKECGLVQTNPRMTQKSYDDFYKNYFSNLQRPMSLDDYFQRQIIRGKEIENYYGVITGNKLKNKKIMDIGCSAGGIVKYLSDVGNDTSGIDLDKQYIEFGKNNGANIKIGKIEDIKSNQKFDLIIYRHTFEHILHPLDELEKIRNICSNHTLVYIEIPSITNIQNYDQSFEKYLTIAHCYHYTLTTLKNMIHKAGFEYISGNNICNMLMKKGIYDEHYKTDYNETVSFLKNLKFKKSTKRRIFDNVVKISHKTKLDPISKTLYRKFGSKYKKLK